MSKTIELTDEQYDFLADLAKDDISADILVARWVDRLRYLAQLPYQTDEEADEFMYLIPPAPEPYFDSSKPYEEPNKNADEASESAPVEASSADV